MAWKDARKLIDARRERVAQLHLRGLTQREIVAALEQQGMMNPETGKPYNVMTVNRDLQALKKQWRANAAQDIALHKALQAAEITEVIRAAWAAKELTTVMKALERQAKLLGLDVPTRIDFRDLDAKIEQEIGRISAD